MFRRRCRARGRGRAFPHSRGDVPRRICSSGVHTSFSPLAWGCSEALDLADDTLSLFPTRVGMFRTAPRACSTAAPFPHSRGDVPGTDHRQAKYRNFSPLAWGCSGGAPMSSPHGRLFPTRVGMFRGPGLSPASPLSFPHSRGDVPPFLRAFCGGVVFSPLAWGCSAHSAAIRARCRLFPTRVGMFRSMFVTMNQPRPFPHSRGDVPNVC